MRQLILLRGVAGCGKSTWLKNHALQQYTLCADDIRLLFQGPILTPDGGIAITQKNDSQVWKFLFELLEQRMARGEFTIIDATHSRAAQINDYRKLAEKYRYRVYVVDFSDLSLAEIKRRNANRLAYIAEAHKYVPETAIENMYTRITTQAVPGWVTSLKPAAFVETLGSTKPIDLSMYTRVHHIGDIHGCAEPLLQYLADGIQPDQFYIFVGDYIDRGIQNAEVLRFLISIMDHKNVLLLEGNHEKWLRMYANGELDDIRSQEFRHTTMQQIGTIDLKDLRQLCRKFGQLAYYTYQDYKVLVTHGGIPVLPTCYIASNEFILGTGKYEDVEQVQAAFERTNPGVYQVHGHRNTLEQPIRATTYCFNLCDTVEHGGNLRVATLSDAGWQTYSIPNTVYKIATEVAVTNETDSPVVTEPAKETVADIVTKLRAERHVREKRFTVAGVPDPQGAISSFSFDRETFFKGGWTPTIELARSMYVNTETMQIVARAYPKWFRIGEREDTKLEALQRTMQFPVTAYVKENGFLGLVGYDEASGQVVYTTKSSLQGDYLGWFKNALANSTDVVAIETWVKEHPYCLVFECIDPVRDPHIIKYKTTVSTVVLLDAVKRDVEFAKLTYQELQTLSKKLRCWCKDQAYQFASYKEFVAWFRQVEQYDYRWISGYVEGFVLEDATGKCVKVKTGFYNTWKWFRSIKETLRRGSNVDTARFVTAIENSILAWLKKQSRETLALDIIQLRDLYEAEIASKEISHE